jgi:hypothetical protein
MFEIRARQVDAFLADEAWFIEWFVCTFMPDHVPGFHQTFDDRELKEMVGRGRRRAIEHGFTDPPSQVHFVTLMFKIGPTFYTFPGFREVTAARTLSDAERIRRYYEVPGALAADAILRAEYRSWWPDPIVGEDE